MTTFDTTDQVTLPLPAPAPTATPRPVVQVFDARSVIEGAGFVAARPFPGKVSEQATDPFFLLDHVGPVDYGPYEAVGAPWHPHRGLETVTYVIDGSIRHRDSNGRGGVIRAGDTQWMTAGAGILHDERPTDELFAHGGRIHGVQLWVNLPAAKKFSPPRYQAISHESVPSLRSPDGEAIVRLIAGRIGGVVGPGATHTPITLVHATLEPAAHLAVPWNSSFNALAFVLTGRGRFGEFQRAVDANQLVVFGSGDSLTMSADEHSHEPLSVLLLGGAPIREPIVHHGPFLMNTWEEILEAIDDFQAGRMGEIPAIELGRAQ
jgi:redox-sensitive bicupin YhaK (pirin superfamily)